MEIAYYPEDVTNRDVIINQNMDQESKENSFSHEFKTEKDETDLILEGERTGISKLLFKKLSNKEIFYSISILALVTVVGIAGYFVYQKKTILTPTETPEPTEFLTTPTSVIYPSPSQTPSPIAVLSPEPTTLPITEEHKILVIMLNFQDNPDNKPFSKEQVHSVFFAEEKSLNSYYKEVSFNRLQFTGEVVGWYTMPYNTSCSWDEQMKQILLEKLKISGINVNDYSHLVYLKPSIGCSPTGTLRCSPSEIFLSGTIELSTLIHEIGHNLSLGYAASISCGDVVIDTYSNCSVNYYGDLFSPQGSSNTFHHNAFHKLSLGWIPATRVQEVTSSGEYTIYPIETAGSGIQVLKIRKKDTNDYYLLEYRRPIGFDLQLSKGVTSGALLHIGFYSESPITDYFKLLNCKGRKADTYLIDAHPETQNDFSDAALTDGAKFHDKVNNITITQLKHDANSVTVSVEL